MRQFFKALILLPVAILVVLLAVANRGPVTISFDPFSGLAPEFSLTLPLFALVFLAVGLGMMIGGGAAWLVQGKHRRARRQHQRELQRLRGDTERLRAMQLPALAAPGARLP